MSKKSSVLALALSVVLVGGMVLMERDVTAEQLEQTGGLPLDELRVFAEVFGRIKNDYVESVEDKQLLKHAIRGMLSGLDPHSSYLSEDEFRDLQVGTSGEFGGLGISIGRRRRIHGLDQYNADRTPIDALSMPDSSPMKDKRRRTAPPRFVDSGRSAKEGAGHCIRRPSTRRAWICQYRCHAET